MVTENENATMDAHDALGRDAMLIAAHRLITATAAMPHTARAMRVEAFPASGDQLAHARQAVWNTTVGHAACGTAVLLSGELAANAIEHSGSRFFGLALGHLPGDRLRITLVDEGHRRFPHLRTGSTPGARGRGLRLVDALALRWGVIRRAHTGAVVWFECGG